MQTERQLREKIQKIKALFEGAGTEGERMAAEAALERMNEILAKRDSQNLIEINYSLRNNWSCRLFIALCRRYSLNPYRYKGQRYTTVMLRVSESFSDEVLWPEFLELDKVLMSYLDSITDRIIAEEVHGDVREAEECNEPLKLPK